LFFGWIIKQSGFMNQRTRLVLLLTLLLAFALRLPHLGAQSLWYDETVSLTLAREPLPDLLAHTARDIHPPGYYLLLAAWLRIAPAAPTPEFISAFFSLSAGILLLPLTFIMGRRLRLPAAVNRLACLLLAASPYHVWYSQEVRMYTLGAGLGLLSAWGLLRTQPSATASAHENTRLGRRGWILYGAAAVAGMYTLYYTAFLLLTLNLLWFGGYLARRQRIPWRPWLLTHLAMLLAYAPWLPTAWRQVTDPPVPPWRSVVSLLTVLRESLLAIWLHGTIEISCIVIAGSAGIVMGNSLLFPGTYARLASFRRGALQGLKIVIGLVPCFILAGFLESFVTRHSPEMYPWASAAIILGSLAFIILYFIVYPFHVERSLRNA